MGVSLEPDWDSYRSLITFPRKAKNWEVLHVESLIDGDEEQVGRGDKVWALKKTRPVLHMSVCWCLISIFFSWEASLPFRISSILPRLHTIQCSISPPKKVSSFTKRQLQNEGFLSATAAEIFTVTFTEPRRWEYVGEQLKDKNWKMLKDRMIMCYR